MARRILIADDEKDIVEMLKYNLQKEGYSVLTAFDGERALQIAHEAPDLILLDIMMPKLDGWEVARRLRSNNRTKHIPLIFLTARSSEVDEVVGFELGADDYIIKPISLPKLLARIRAVFRRGETSAERVEKGTIRIGEIEINPSEYVVRIAKKEVIFPKKEFELLVYIAERRDQVVTREEILNSVWGEDVYVVDRTVDVHISKIREKLGRYAGFIETVKGVGYRMREK